MGANTNRTRCDAGLKIAITITSKLVVNVFREMEGNAYDMTEKFFIFSIFFCQLLMLLAPSQNINSIQTH